MGTLSFSYGKPYGHKGRAGTCRWCGDPLRPENPGGNGGYRDNGLFCTLRCGYQWAVRAALRAAPSAPVSAQPAPREPTTAPRRAGQSPVTPVVTENPPGSRAAPAVTCGDAAAPGVPAAAGAQPTERRHP